MKFIVTFFFILSILLLQACKKQDTAGLGGNSNVTIQAQHHGLRIDSVTIFIKFNAQDAPNENDYDLQQKVATSGNEIGSIIFKGLKKGKYYILAKGWDVSIGKDVIGGIPYIIENEIDLNVIVPVTEDH
jgi:hypothetical protein